MNVAGTQPDQTLPKRQWGYENWIYTAIAIWGFDRAIRLTRSVRNGVKTARVTIIDGDYMRVNIEGASGSGWRVWENHPFSVASVVLPPSDSLGAFKHDLDLEKLGSSTGSSDRDSHERRPHQSPATIGLTFLLRTQTGVTAQLQERMELPVLIESVYGPHEDLSAHCLALPEGGALPLASRTCAPIQVRQSCSEVPEATGS
ncbi:MAG: hypothetical protein Q9214_003278 [Letrouitia sp. 1 TL-2023]